MDHIDLNKQEDWQEVAGRIRSSTCSELEKLAQGFGWITQRIIEQGEKETELARALRDEEFLVKLRIKTAAMRHARTVFQHCHLLATGRKAWDE